MKNKIKKFGAAQLACILCFTVLMSACSSPKQPASTQSSDSSEMSDPSETLEIPEQDSQSSNIYDLPYMGLKIVLPETLLERMDRGDLMMLTNEVGTEDGSALKYSILSWNVILDETDMGTDFECIGTIGVYQNDQVDLLDELTGCDEHKELGQSMDGAYKYYLSTNMKADETLAAELNQIQITITQMADYQTHSDYDAPTSQFTGKSLGEFTTQDIYGKAYTQEIFQDYDLTLVNVFTTWCSPCVAEIPDLEKLYQKMKDRGVNVVGVVLDVLNEKGEIVQEDLERAQLLAEQTGATYPILLPDTTYLNGRLIGIEAFPETFFVDKNGNVVGGTYSGSGSLEDWLSVVEEELANLKEGA